MTGLSNRERGFEAKFAQDEQIQFRVQARRARLFGQWVADRLGLHGDDANRYVFQLIDLATGSADDATLIDRAALDLVHHNAAADRSELTVVFNDFLAVARRRIHAGL